MNTRKTDNSRLGNYADADAQPASSLSALSSTSSTPAHFGPDELLPLSALQHYLYCPRQCALIHIEQVWTENVFTAKGRIMHDRSDTGKATIENGVKIARSVQVASHKLGLFGVCDVVEFQEDIPVPVEYKRGKPKAHRADEVQLCAQAICLEEMFEISIPSAVLFYGKPKRRSAVNLDDELRNLTHKTAKECHEFIETGRTPSAEYDNARCSACSLLDVCMPVRKKQRKNVDKYLAEGFEDEETKE